MKLLACYTTLLCLWFSATAQEFDIRQILDQIDKEITTGRYTARVEVTSNNKDDVKKTYTIVEYHDANTGVHSIEMTPLNVRKYLYTNTKEKKYVSVTADGTCTVQNVADAADLVDSFLYKSRDPLITDYFLGPTSVITGIKKDFLINNEPTPAVVRGINANVYSNLAEKDPAKIEIMLFFAKDWKIDTLSENKVPFPIRIIRTQDGNVDQYDFYQVEHLSDAEAFRLGENLHLPFGLKDCTLPTADTMEVPSLLNMFSFTSEANGVYETEYFSIPDKLYRVDQSEGTTVIHDDQHAIIYELERQCKAKPNDDADDKVVSRGSLSYGAQIVQAYQILKQKYYVGEGFVRGIPVDVWDAVGDDANFKAARFFFAKDGSIVSAGGEADSRILVKATILEPLNHDAPIDVNIYDFFSTVGNLDFRKNFNIEECVEASMYVEIVWQADKSFNLEQFQSSNALAELIELTEEAIGDTTGASSLQLPSFKAEVVDDRHVQVFARILSPPEYLKSFTKRQALVKHYSVTPRDSHTEQTCAQSCVGDEKCVTFLFCSGESQCYLMNDKTNWGTEIAGSAQDCSVYDKSGNVDQIARFELDKMADLLENAISLGFPQFSKSVTTSEGVIPLRGQKFYSHLNQFNEQGALGPYKFQFARKSISETYTGSVAIEGRVLTAGECYRECRANKGVSCSSFSICTSAARCVLTGMNINSGSHNDPEQAAAIKDATADCTIYSVNYLSEFDRLDGKVRKTGDLENADAMNAGTCAVMCRQNDLKTLEECRSFTFCYKAAKCFFYRTHYGWDGGDASLSTDTECDHYALRYSASYTAVGKGVFTEQKLAKKVAAISFDECAKQCSEQSNDKCKTISYCNSPLPGKEAETCYMYALNVEEAGKSNDENTCTVYTKDAALIDEVINPDRQSEKQAGGKTVGMGDGAFAFLLIAMLAVGAVIGVMGYTQRDKVLALIGRSRSSNAAETTISYNRQDDENRGGDA